MKIYWALLLVPLTSYAVDKVRPLKMEHPSTGGTQTDTRPKETDPLEDYLSAKGVALTGVDSCTIGEASGSIFFMTNSLERMRIGFGGNVGIGSTAPAAKLDVNGSIKSSSLTTERVLFSASGGLIVDDADFRYASSTNTLKLGSGSPSQAGARIESFHSGSDKSVISVRHDAQGSVSSMMLEGPNSTDLNTGKALELRVTGESFGRGLLYRDGGYCMGSGGASLDTCLDRPLASTLRISSDKAGGVAHLLLSGKVTQGHPTIDADSAAHFMAQAADQKVMELHGLAGQTGMYLWAFEGTQTTPKYAINATGEAMGLSTSRIVLAQQFENPISSDFAVNSLAPIEGDPTNSGVLVRAFDDATDECIVWTQYLPSGSVTLELLLHTRPRTAPTSDPVDDVELDLYARNIPAAGDISAWSAALSLPSVDYTLASNDWQVNSFVIALTSIGLAAGNMAQFELCRDANDVADDLPGDVLLHNLRSVLKP